MSTGHFDAAARWRRQRDDYFRSLIEDPIVPEPRLPDPPESDIVIEPEDPGGFSGENVGRSNRAHSGTTPAKPDPGAAAAAGMSDASQMSPDESSTTDTAPTGTGTGNEEDA